MLFIILLLQKDGVLGATGSFPLQSNLVPSYHPPVLKMNSAEGFLPESAEMGTTVRISPSPRSESLQIVVLDEDLKPGMSPAVYEYIVTGIGASIFAVDQRGFLYLNAANIDADPPNPSNYQLTVEAREVNTTPIRSSEPVSVTIHILDVNDNPPVFATPIYIANVSATGPDRAVLEVFATDKDASENGQINYKITFVTEDAYAHFRYDADSKQLIAMGDLIPDTTYQVVLEATDGGGMSNQAIILIHTSANAATGRFNNLREFHKQGSISSADQTPLQSPQIHRISSNSEGVQTFVTEINEATPPHSVILTLGVAFFFFLFVPRFSKSFYYPSLHKVNPSKKIN